MVDHTNDQSTGVQPQEGLLHDVDPSLTEANEVAKALDVDTNTGLSSAEAQRRLEKFGPNQLASAPPVPKWKKFLAQFQDPLVYLLLAATVISLIAWFIERSHGTAGEVLPFDAIVIILILIVNAVLGYIQEARAEQAVEALAQMTAPQTSVLRDGKIVHINTADVVPGDIVVLGEGDTVSADGRLFAAASLRIAEASLTGESVPVGKKPDTLDSAKALGDRVQFTGYIPNEDLPDYYRLADLVCVPTLVEEAAGLVAVEAMGCGRPVLATRSGGMPEYLDGSQAVLVDRDGNVAGQLSFAIRMLYEHPDLRAQMSTAGAKTAQRYSSARFYDDFVRIVYDFGGHLWNSPSSV